MHIEFFVCDAIGRAILGPIIFCIKFAVVPLYSIFLCFGSWNFPNSFAMVPWCRNLMCKGYFMQCIINHLSLNLNKNVIERYIPGFYFFLFCFLLIENGEYNETILRLLQFIAMKLLLASSHSVSFSLFLNVSDLW